MGELASYQRNVAGLLFAKDPDPFLRALGGRETRWRVYRRMARHRLSEVMQNSFPRLVAVLGEPAFDDLVERFFDESPPISPYIRDIPGELAAFLERIGSTSEGLPTAPPWIVELARHEWALLDTSYIAEEQGAMRADVSELSMDRPAVLSPAHRLLRSRWSVHRLSAPRDGSPVDASVVEDGVGHGGWALCLYRDATSHEVRALELTPLSASLLEGVAPMNRPLVDVVREVAERAGVEIDTEFVSALSDLVADLVERGLWLGSLSEAA